MTTGAGPSSSANLSTNPPSTNPSTKLRTIVEDDEDDYDEALRQSKPDAEPRGEQEEEYEGSADGEPQEQPLSIEAAHDAVEEEEDEDEFVVVQGLWGTRVKRRCPTSRRTTPDPPRRSTAQRALIAPSTRQRQQALHPLQRLATVAPQPERLLVAPLYSRHPRYPTPWLKFQMLTKPPSYALGSRAFAGPAEWRAELIRREVDDIAREGVVRALREQETERRAAHKRLLKQQAWREKDKARKRKRCEEEEEERMAKFADERAKRFVRMNRNPFANINIYYPPQLKPVPTPRAGQVAITTEPDGTRRKCDYCRMRSAVVRKRAFRGRAATNELVSMCSLCERRHKSGRIMQAPWATPAPVVSLPAATAEDLASIRAAAEAARLNRTWDKLWGLSRLRKHAAYQGERIRTRIQARAQKACASSRDLVLGPCRAAVAPLWPPRPARLAAPLKKKTMALLQSATDLNKVLRKFLATLPEALAALAVTDASGGGGRFIYGRLGPDTRVGSAPTIYNPAVAIRRKNTAGNNKPRANDPSDPRLFFGYLA